MSYFATLNETVIDGTMCTRPTEYLKRNYYGRAICVEGTCKVSFFLLIYIIYYIQRYIIFQNIYNFIKEILIYTIAIC